MREVLDLISKKNPTTIKTLGRRNTEMSDVLLEILEPKLAERDAKRDAERDAKRDAERDAVHDAELKKQYSVFNCARRKNVFGICCSMVTSVHRRICKPDEP